MGMLHAVAVCIVYFLHLLTQRVHFLVELFQHLGDVIHLFCIFIWPSQICRHRVKWWAGGLGRTWCQAESRDGTNKGVAGDRCGLVTIKIQKLYWSHYSQNTELQTRLTGWWCYLNWVLTAIYLPHDLDGVSSLAAPYSSNHNYANCAYSTHSWSWQLDIYTPAPGLMWTVIRKQSWSVALCLSV